MKEYQPGDAKATRASHGNSSCNGCARHACDITWSYSEDIPLLYYMATPHFLWKVQRRKQGTYPHTSRPICRIIISTDKSCQISLCGVQTNPRRIAMLRGLGNIESMQYLGLPLKKDRKSNTGKQSIIEKVKRRLEGWQAKLLSMGEQWVLL